MTHLFKRHRGEWYRRSTGRRPDRAACVRWENHNQLGGCAMKPNPKISATVAAILSAPATAVVLAAAETATATGTPTELQEVIVTAERRAETVQDVPITIQALTSETLTQLNVKTFDDFVKYLPNVTAGGYGPGQSNVFIRGLATSIGGTQGVGATGSFPNVATYLDDQSGPAGRLHGSLSRSQHHAAAGLHQLLARPVRGLLPV